MTSSLLDDTATAPRPGAIRFRAPHDVEITRVALEMRADDLKKLAEKTSKEGYRREGRAMQADADAIGQSILPALREQRELPLVTVESLEKEVTAALQLFCTQAFSGLGDPKVVVTPSSVAERRDRLIKNLATRVTLYVVDVADDAFNQGVAARGHTGEALAMRAISTLRAGGE